MPRRFKRWRAAGTVVSLVALLIAWMPVAMSAGSVTLEFRPSGPLSTPQGTAFDFEALLHNPEAEAVRVDLQLRLPNVDRTRLVTISAGSPSVPAGGTVSLRQSVITSQWYPETGPHEVEGLIDGAVANSLEFEVTAPTVAVPKFQDATGEAGLDTAIQETQCGSYTAGAAWGDVDGDKDLDLFVPQKLEPSQLWINDGTGHFADEAAGRGADNAGAAGVGAVFADYDNDGDQDLYVVNDEANRLYRNDGTGRFDDVAQAAGVTAPTIDASASWGDYDGDGHLDLYVVTHTLCLPPDFYQRDWLYHNEGDGTFTDQTSRLPEEATFGAGFQAAWWDYDNDGDQDLYLANDEWGPQADANHLWRNDGPDGLGGWRFTDVSAESGTGYLINSMGIGLGDYDRDLDLDLAISNIGPTVVGENQGDGTFTEVARALGVDRPSQRPGTSSVTWGLVFSDLNLDGWEDLFVVAGSLADLPRQPDMMFVNDAGTGFLDLSAVTGVDDRRSGRGVAVADYDGDGRIDLYVLQMDGSPRLYRNVTASTGHWLEVDLTGTSSNRDACGARAVLAVRGGKMLRQVFCGSTGLSSGGDTTVHFGLGSDSRPSRLVIRWPSGIRQVIDRPAVDRVLEVTEP